MPEYMCTIINRPFLCSSANNFALKNKRKTLSAGDVFSALEDMEFEEFIPELKDCLEGIPTLSAANLTFYILL